MLRDGARGEYRSRRIRNVRFLGEGRDLSLKSSSARSESMGSVNEIRRGTLETQTFYEQVGGEETFRRLVHRFYEGVAEDPVLRPMYPEEDLGPAEERLTLFLIQYWGGPTTYSDNRGHPRLRMRHAPFTVNREAHDAWLRHMRDAVDDLGLSEEHEQQLWKYLTYAAASMVNAPD
ncbi:globin [Streptomyces coacervatus]|uniref:Globin n=2 Tax=Streptomyces coacervatus TaxID=647381 RepID=A0ABP7IR53_9ACTN